MLSAGTKTIFFVASTMPASWISSKLAFLDIKKIIVANRNLELSYRAVISEYHDIAIVCVPDNIAARFGFYLFELLLARFQKVNVIFFHECCATDLDLLIMLIKPRGYFFPIVTMEGFNEVRFSEIPRKKITCLIWILGLIPHFKYYRSPVIDSANPEYVISARRYPQSVVTTGAINPGKMFFDNQRVLTAPTNRVLFVLGKSFVDDLVQVEIFKRLISLTYSFGYVPYTKDHPNPNYRLDYQFKFATVCDPLIPVELLGLEFDYVVGVSSTALLHFGVKSISIVNLMSTNISSHDLILIKSHFEAALPGNCIKYLSSYDEFRLLLK